MSVGAASAEVETPGQRVASLSCEACGHRDPVRRAARVHGWQRCSHCGSVTVAPWSEAEALDGPSARTVVLQRRGRVQFSVPRRTLFSTVEVAGALFLANTLAAVGVAGFELEAEGAVRAAGALGFAAAGLLASAWAVRRWRSVQHLEVSPYRLVAYRTVGARTIARSERSLRGRRLEAEVDRPPFETYPYPRSRIRLRVRGGGDEAPPIDLVVASELEARWVVALIERAADPERGKAARCAGCGAPLALTLEEHARGSVTCGYCEAGFLLEARRLRWPQLTLSYPAPIDPRHRPARIRASRARGIHRWEILPDHLGARVLHAFGMLYGILLFGGMGIFLFWVVPETPAGTVGLKLYVVSAGLTLLGMSLAMTGLVAMSLLGRDVIELDEATVRTDLRIGRWRYGGWRRAAGAVPIVRLTSVGLARPDDATSELLLATPNRTLRIDGSLAGADGRWLCDQLMPALAERLRALGRDVALLPR